MKTTEHPDFWIIPVAGALPPATPPAGQSRTQPFDRPFAIGPVDDQMSQEGIWAPEVGDESS